jgi:iron complex outermembrane recepter protein
LVHLDYVYRSRMFAAAGAGRDVPGGDLDTQPAYGLLNGRITLTQETDWAHQVKFSFWGRNILNRRYYQPALGVGPGLTGYTSTTPATFAGYTGRAGAWAEPRTYGLAIRYEY